MSKPLRFICMSILAASALGAAAAAGLSAPTLGRTRIGRRHERLSLGPNGARGLASNGDGP
jgi:hypothetical protein